MLLERPASGLYIVATPIGNRGDLSPRAARLLEAANVIAAEDTRTLRRLGLDLPGRLVGLTEHNVEQRAPELVRAATEGVVAVVSEAGTPAVADPGARLAAAAHEAGVPVFAVPGPSALAAALSVAGFTGERACFMGFLPRKEGERRRALESAASGAEILVFFESPGRLAKSLVTVAQAFDDPEVAVCRELTKIHEEVVRGAASALAERFAAARGECTVVVRVPAAYGEAADDRELLDYLGEMRRAGAQRAGAASEAAKRYGVPRKQAYEAWGQVDD